MTDSNYIIMTYSADWFFEVPYLYLEAKNHNNEDEE